MKGFYFMAIISALTTACQSLPEGQDAYGTTAMTRMLDPDGYQALAAEADPDKEDAFASRYRKGNTGQTMQPVMR